MYNNYSKINPYEGLLKGNLFDNSYVPYKNYYPTNINPTSERQRSMLMIQVYSFALNDLDLYLDIYSNDVNAIKLYNAYLKSYKNAVTDYESKFGPITLTSNYLSSSPWSWETTIWPWEVK